MLRKLRAQVLERKTLAAKIAAIMAQPEFERNLNGMWFTLTEGALDIGDIDVEVPPEYWYPYFAGGSYSSNSEIPVSIDMKDIPAPYEKLLKIPGAYLYEDTIKWEAKTSQGGLQLRAFFIAKIPKEDLDLLTEIGVRKVFKSSYTNTSYVCASPDTPKGETDVLPF